MQTILPLITGAALVGAVYWFFFDGDKPVVPVQLPADTHHANATTELTIIGMECAACVARVEKAARSVPGVVAAEVNLLAGRGIVKYDPSRTDGSTIARAIDAVGFEANTATSSSSGTDHAKAAHDLWLKFGVAATFALPILVGSMGMDLRIAVPDWLTNPFLQLVLSIPVLFWSGARFFRGAWAAIRHRSADMNVLVALGASSAFGYSVAVTVNPAFGKHTYFETAAVIVTLILFGRYLEARAKGKAGAAIESLLGLQSKTARLVRSDGRDEEIMVTSIQVGDRLRVWPGERIPADASIFEGVTTVDESLLTGESVPVEKSFGDTVTGGTVNGNGAIVIEVTRTGADTTLAAIVRLVRQAQTSRAPIQQFADRITGVFVPVVLMIAIATATLWSALGHPALAFSNAVAVLIIACPCALGLATPTSLSVAIGVAAARGVIIKNAEAIERLQHVDVVVFDKTGTLTEGILKLTAMGTVDDSVSSNDLLRILASAEQGSEHPVGRAVVEAAIAGGLPLSSPWDYSALPGLGLKALVDGGIVIAGNRALLESNGIRVDRLDSAMEQFAAEGKTPIYVAIDGALAGFAAVADTIRPGAISEFQRLKRLGMKLVVLSGDAQRTVDALASIVAADVAIAGVLPADKVRNIEALQNSGRLQVAMVGDGINDAAALARADVGIAMSGGADVAISASDITLIGGELSGISFAITLSKGTMANVRQNLFFALAYNCLGIPIAAGLLYPIFGYSLSPMIASAAMALSSVSVVSNALRLRRFGRLGTQA